MKKYRKCPALAALITVCRLYSVIGSTASREGTPPPEPSPPPHERPNEPQRLLPGLVS